MPEKFRKAGRRKIPSHKPRRTFPLPDLQAFPDAPDLSSPMAVRRIGAAATAAKPLEYLVMKYRLEK
jgi:hypothetical protein